MQTKDVKMKSQVNFELDPNGERQLTNTVILGLLLAGVAKNQDPLSCF